MLCLQRSVIEQAASVPAGRDEAVMEEEEMPARQSGETLVLLRQVTPLRERLRCR